MSSVAPSAHQRNLIEAHRRRIWGLCYRMTGDATAADDLAQDALERAIERAGQATDDRFEGWLYRVASTTCLDYLRRRKIETRAVTLVDPIDLAEAPFATEAGAEARLLRREDVRFAILTSLQSLSPEQRAVLVLRDVLDRSTQETAAALGLTPANVRVLLHRARVKLQEVHRVDSPDAPVDANVVERFARTLESGNVEALTELLADDVWGLIDDGVRRRRPTLGIRAVARQWANAFARYRGATLERIRFNAEPALVARLGDRAVAAIHLETSRARVVAIRVLLDPSRLSALRKQSCVD